MGIKDKIAGLFCTYFGFHFHSKSSTVLSHVLSDKEKNIKAITSHCKALIFFSKSVLAIERIGWAKSIPPLTSVAFFEMSLPL